MLISNKPNIRSLEDTVTDIKYRIQLIGRDQRLFGGIIATRVYGVIMGFILAVLLVIIPVLIAVFRLQMGV
ncbi:MAG: tetrahydromethanopterin S-methyltransferase subunit F [Euryarchaeota archaeon]|nr:tetrahydromethanopterin S-methyltransferase subunit F [Euryarchaeota archaeon]